MTNPTVFKKVWDIVIALMKTVYFCTCFEESCLSLNNEMQGGTKWKVNFCQSLLHFLTYFFLLETSSTKNNNFIFKRNVFGNYNSQSHLTFAFRVLKYEITISIYSINFVWLQNSDIPSTSAWNHQHHQLSFKFVHWMEIIFMVT